MLVGTFNGDPVVTGQHPDAVQCAGNYIKIHDNTFSNVLDSGIDWDTWSITSPHDQWIYNNVFENSVTRNTTDDYPEYIRVYSSGGNQTSFTNFKIWNNTFADDPDWDAVSFSVKGSPTGSGNEIKNNIFYYDGKSSSSSPNAGHCWRVDYSSGFTSGSWSCDGNVYFYTSNSPAYVEYGATAQTASSWIAANEPHGQAGKAVAFVSYGHGTTSTGNPGGLLNNDFHVTSADMTARTNGVNLSAYFSTDKDGNARPSSGAWDVGAFQSGGSSSSGTPSSGPTIQVSLGSLDFGVVLANTSSNQLVTVQNTGGGTLTGSVTSVSAPFQVVSEGTITSAAISRRQ